MTGSWAKLISRNARAECVALAAVLCGVAAILGGCAERKVHAFPWATGTMVKPNLPVGHATGNSDANAIAPDFSVAVPPSAGKLLGARPLPARPHVAAQPQPENSGGARATILVPEMSPQETAAAQQQFAESMAIVEKNVAVAKSKSLSAAQMDSLSKINAFAAEAREASGEGDWGRARNLAKKAQILSEDLIASI
jgi:hypothetical protein